MVLLFDSESHPSLGGTRWVPSVPSRSLRVRNWKVCHDYQSIKKVLDSTGDPPTPTQVSNLTCVPGGNPLFGSLSSGDGDQLSHRDPVTVGETFYPHR